MGAGIIRIIVLVCEKDWFGVAADRTRWVGHEDHYTQLKSGCL